jgi:lipopolysaccharide transport system ATP-binding protein
MRPIINVESMGKEYVIGALERRDATLREALMRTLRSPWRALRPKRAETVWALRDISFTAAPGDVMGVIGKNGAGKSTLLKILSRITEPTAGRAELYGRVGSLLEIGTGFHQDLTGRENVHLNGAILGMKRAEINRKFDDIVAFAEVARFIDTPVKRYSSGMYLRLAFAVAAFLESEILLVDEVLAVGDASFQKRCLGKMREVSASGRTVLFVSHNMAAIESLCNRCLYISNGRLQGLGVPHDLIGKYLSAEMLPQAASTSLTRHPGRQPGAEVVMRGVTLRTANGEPGAAIRMGSGLSVEVDYHGDRALCPVLGLVVKNNFGAPLFGINNLVTPGYQFDTPSQSGAITCVLRDLPLMPDTYSIDLYFGDGYHDRDVVYDAATFEVVAADVFGSGRLPGAECGSFYWPATWTYRPADEAVLKPGATDEAGLKPCATDRVTASPDVASRRT